MIGKAVGLKKGSLYHHIKSKNDLLFNVFEDVIEDVNMGLKNIVHSDLPPIKNSKKRLKIILKSESNTLMSIVFIYKKKHSSKESLRQDTGKREI
jgi:AcrR family transcriptional regulator